MSTRDEIARKNRYARVACAPLCWQEDLITCSVLNAFFVQFSTNLEFKIYFFNF